MITHETTQPVSGRKMGSGTPGWKIGIANNSVPTGFTPSVFKKRDRERRATVRFLFFSFERWGIYTKALQNHVDLLHIHAHGDLGFGNRLMSISRGFFLDMYM